MFCVGDRVQVVSTTKTYEKYLSTIGLKGTVVRHSNKLSSDYGVKIDDIDNPNSLYNCFWYRERDLLIDMPINYNEDIKVNKGVENMNKKYILSDLYGLAKVSFLEGNNTDKMYDYLLFDKSITVGSTVVVSSAHHGMGIAVVRDITTDKDIIDEHFCMDTLNREIICEVNMSDYYNRVENRKTMQKNEAKRKRLMAEMDEKLAASKDLIFYEKMAENNPEIRELLEQYKLLI